MLRWLIVFSLIVAFFRVDAQVTTLTLSQALKLGSDSSRVLQISNARLQIAEAKYNQAIDATLPSVRLSAGYTRLSDIEEPKFLFPGATEPVSLFPVYLNNYHAALSVSETIFSGFRLKYARESQKLLRDAARLENESDKNENAFLITSAFFNLYKLQTSAKVIAENLNQIRQRVKETEAAQRNGLVNKNEVLRWQLQQSNLELTQMDIASNIEIAEYNFNLMLGLQENGKVIPDSNSVNEPIAEKTFEEYLTQALEKRNDLSSSSLKSKAAMNILKVSQNSYLPRIALNGEFLDARPNPRYIPPVDEFNTTWSAGISFNWDLVSIYSNRHNVDESRALYKQSLENKEILNDAIRSEVHQNYLLFKEAQQKKTVMENTVAQAKENYRLMDSRYKNSLSLMSDLLDANNQQMSDPNFKAWLSVRVVTCASTRKNATMSEKTINHLSIQKLIIIMPVMSI